MGALAEIIISLLNLLEAEGRALRAGVARLAVGLALAALVSALLILGMVLVILSLYLYLRSLDAAPPMAALLAGVVTLLFAGVISWAVVKIAK